MSTDTRNIILLPDDKSIKVDDIYTYITDECKLKYSIRDIHTLSSDQEFKQGLLNLLSGDAYVSDFGFTQTLNMCKSKNIRLFLLPGKYSIRMKHGDINLQTIRMFGITKENDNYPTVNVDSYIKFNVETFTARNIKFEINNTNTSAFFCSDLLESGALIFSTPKNIIFKRCIVDNKADKSVEFINVSNCDNSMNIHTCVFMNTQIKCQRTRKCIIKNNTFNNSIIQLRRGNSTIFKNIAKNSRLHTFNEHCVMMNNTFENIDIDYSTLFIDYESQVFMSNNILHNVLGTPLYIDRYSKVHIQGGEFLNGLGDSEEMKLGDVKFGSKLSLERNKYDRHTVNIKVDTDCCIKELNNMTKTDNNVKFNITEKDCVRHVVFTH